MLKYGFLLASLGMIVRFWWKPWQVNEAWLSSLLAGPVRYRVLIAMAVSYGFLYYQFPMYKSLLGDAELFAEKLGERTTEYDAKYTANLFTPNILNPKNGNLTVLSAVRLFSLTTGWTHSEAYQLMDAFFGMLFVAIWLVLVHKLLENVRLKILLAVLGMAAPFTQFFFGYEEI